MIEEESGNIIIIEIFNSLNKLRQDPKSFIPLIKQQMALMKGDSLIRSNQPPILTYEGIAAFEESITFLQSQDPVDEVSINDELSQAAEDLVNDIGPKGFVSHEDSNGLNLNDRVEKYIEWDDQCLESIQLAGRTGDEVIIDLLVNDGVVPRMDRENLFNSNVKFVGIGSGPHKDFGTINVIIFTGNLREKGSLCFNYDNYKYEYPSEMGKKKRIVNDYQYDDPYAPDDAIGVVIKKENKEYKGKKIIVTKKCYMLENGKEHIVEVEEF